MTDITRISILGAGTIGASWAAFFLSRGLEVAVFEPDKARADGVRAAIDRCWPALTRLGLADGADQSAVSIHDDPRKAVEGAHLVQENAPERLELKHELYRTIAPALGPDALFASSTSTFMPSLLQEGLPFAERLIVAHPFNPPHLIPLVEIVGGKATSPATIERAMAFFAAVGKKPVHIRREVPGHLVNRLQAAIWREAVHAMASGIASFEDVDAAIAYGPGLRWALMGPHLTFGMAGGEGGMKSFLDHLAPPNVALWEDLGTPQLTPDIERQLMEGFSRECGDRSIAALREERDEYLVRILEHTKRLS